jgi:hypothetical protein
MLHSVCGHLFEGAAVITQQYAKEPPGFRKENPKIYPYLKENSTTSANPYQK